jgi:hypothetical protein
MDNKEFAELLERALSGDNDALQSVLDEYAPLFRSRSVINGKFDEDCYQYILLRAIEMTRKFKIEE